MSLKERTCIICGKEFKPRTANGTMCSPECRKVHHNRTCAERTRKRRAEQKERIAAGLEEAPVPRTKPKERWIKKIYKPRVCDRCGGEFQPQNSTQRYCSAKCRNPGVKKAVEQAKRMSALAEDEAKARDADLTYGKWRGLQILEREKLRKEKKK